MSGQPPLWQYAETRFASTDRKPAESERHAPRQNLLLAALPRADYERLLPDLKRVPLAPGRTVYGNADREKYLHFLAAGIVARVCVTESGASAAFAVAGREGVIGVASCYNRGHIAVLDRRGLEARACECYAVVEREYDRLLRPEDLRRDACVHTVHRRFRHMGDESAYA